MLAAIAKILGSDAVISKGMELIDDAWTTDEERTEARAKAKIALMNAYAPFKVAQRYLALMFASVFLSTYILTMVYALLGESTDAILQVIEQFSMNWIMGVIVLFYFGGGLAESIQKKGPNRASSVPGMTGD
jgi:hypothetical protein